MTAKDPQPKGETGEQPETEGRGALAVPKPAAQRISLYLRSLEALRAQGCETISSRQLGETLGLTAAQVRKDLGHFGQFGFPGVGYKIPELTKQIRRILGTDRVWNVALVGMGNLGSALARYRGFASKGFRIVALFDVDPDTVSRVPGAHVMDDLERIVREEAIELGILAVPAEAAQQVAERMVCAGIQGLLNFAPRVLNLPESVCTVSVDLAIQLEQLTLGLSRDGVREA